MSDEAARFADVDALFRRVRRLPAGERTAALDAASDHVASEVRALLDVDDERFLDTPALGRGFRCDDVGAEVARPECIGPYAILDTIGEGGMGIVYRAAHDESPHDVVALKVIRPGALTPTILRRFEHEADVLSRMAHPGIARVHDADTTPDGVPYLAMELVDGVDLISHARRAGLDRRARLELFAELCDAVEHAHALGVVHRDLKPANVLVTDGDDGHARPKVLDFGIARVTDADVGTTLRTDPGALLGTVRYMSPEQAAGDASAVDARADVHALGVLLFELLTGRVPRDVDGRPLHEVLRALREDDPARLSDVDPSLVGELDTLVGQALEPDRARRYASAGALGDDVRRVLAGEPIVAEPPSTYAVLRRQLRRHRVALTVVGAVVVALAVGLVAVALQWRQTRGARDLAEARLDELRVLADAFVRDVDAELMHLPGALPARRALVETALASLDPLADVAAGDADLLATLVRCYARIGDIQGLPGVPNLGRADGARASWRRALGLLDDLEELAPAPLDVPFERHNLLARLGDVARAEGRAAEALAHYEASQAAWRRARSVDDGRPMPLRERVADVLFDLGRDDEAHAERQAAADETAAWVADHPDDWRARRDAAVSTLKRAMRAERDGDVEQAVALYAGFTSTVEALLTDRPRHAVLQRDVASGHNRWADALRSLGRRDEADMHLAEASRRFEAILAADPSDAQALDDVCMTVNRSGETALADGRLDEARAHFARFLEITERLVALDDGRPDFLRRHGVALFKRGEVHEALAADESLPADARREHRATARDAYARCHAHFVAMREHGRLAVSDAGVPDEVAARVAACDEALAEP